MTTPTIPNILRAAAALVADGWTQASYARDEHGGGVSSGDASACCFCALGAIRRATQDLLPLADPVAIATRTDTRCVSAADYSAAVDSATRALFRVLPLAYRAGATLPAAAVTSWNDARGRTAADVLAALEAAAG